MFRDWDPIGVNDRAPENEYDSYIDGVYRIVASGASERAVAEHLRQLETVTIECPTNDEHRLAVAKRLRSLDLSL